MKKNRFDVGEKTGFDAQKSNRISIYDAPDGIYRVDALEEHSHGSGL